MFLIQWPNRSRKRKMNPRMQSSMHMAIHTPFSPKEGASKSASEMRMNQILPRFMQLGIMVFPAPTKIP